MVEKLLENYPAFLEKKLDELWLTEKLEAALPVLRCFDARKVILTGNSEGMAAVTSVLGLFQESDIFWGPLLVSQAKYNYGGCRHEVGIGEPNTPLVIVTDLDGNDEDAADSIRMTSEVGGVSLLVTVNEHAKYASDADYVLSLGEVSNIAEAYSAAVIALTAVAYRIGRARGQYTEADCRRAREMIQDYALSVDSVYGAIDGKVQLFARETYDKETFDCIADGSAKAVMEFSSFLLTRYGGCLCTRNDSDEWCGQMEAPVIAVACKVSPSYDCFREKIMSAQSQKRPWMIITDGGEKDFNEGVKLCQMPALPKGYDFLCALFFHLPVVTACEYIAEFRRGRQ